MATTQVMKATSELKDGEHLPRPGADVSMNHCPSRCRESQRDYVDRYKLDNGFVISRFHVLRCEYRSSVIGSLQGQGYRKWFSPPDPSTNYNTACVVYQNVSSMWFFGADLFKDWMSNGSLLWVHGKCTFLSYFATQLLIASLSA